MNEQERNDTQYPDSDPWIPQEELCQKCGVRRIDRSANKNSILCHECREEQIRYPFPKKMLPAVILVLLLMVLAMARTPRTFRMYQLYSQAEELAAGGDVYLALSNLQTVLEVYPDSLPVAVRTIDIAMDHGYYDAAAYTLDTYLVGKEVSDTIYSKVTAYTHKLNCYFDTADQVEQLFASAVEGAAQENPDDASTETVVLGDEDPAGAEGPSINERLTEELLEMAKDQNLDKGLIYYYLAILTENEEEAVDYLEASVEADPLLGVPAVTLGTYRRRDGDLEAAKACYKSVLDNDRNHTGALRAMGILRLLEGDMDGGLEDVQKAYDLNPEETYVKETLVIALMECGQEEEAQQLRLQFESEGAEFDPEFVSYLNGGVSLHDYYIDEK